MILPEFIESRYPDLAWHGFCQGYRIYSDKTTKQLIIFWEGSYWPTRRTIDDLYFFMPGHTRSAGGKKLFLACCLLAAQTKKKISFTPKPNNGKTFRLTRSF